MRISDWSSDVCSSDLDITGGEQGSDIEIRRGDLAAALYEATRDTVTYRFSDSIETLEEKNDGVEVRFVSGDTEQYDIVIGADGLHSHVRSLVFGPTSPFERYLGFCFLGFTLDRTRVVRGKECDLR